MQTSDFLALLEATAAPKLAPVMVPGWGIVYVKPPTVEEVDAASDFVEPDDGKKRRFARGAARVLCNAVGERLLDPANEAHVALLAKQPWSLLQKVLHAADARGVDEAGN